MQANSVNLYWVWQCWQLVLKRQFTSFENTAMSADTSPSLQLLWESSIHPIVDVDEFGFQVKSQELADSYSPGTIGSTQDGTVRYGDESVEVQFRVRRVTGTLVRCGFYDLALKKREKIVELSKLATNTEKDELHNLSYDELAGGNTSKQPEGDDKQKALSSGTSTIKKAIATLIMCGAVLGIFLWLIIVVRSRSTITVTRGVMVGNFQPVNTPYEGLLLDLKVDVGDRVTKGQVLAVVDNPEGVEELEIVKTKLFRANRELEAHQRHILNVEAMFPYLRSKIEGELSIAKAELAKIDAQSQAAQSQLDRLMPLKQSNNIPLAEFDEVESLVALSKADRVRQLAVIDNLGNQLDAIDSKMIISGSATDPLSEVRRDIELAQATVDELTALEESIKVRIKPTELLAPSDGTVYAVYHRPGEYLKSADEALAVSLDGEAWATGHIDSSLATNVKPGQPVSITIPSLGIETTGIVSGVGHRSVYGRGGYNADFRAGPLDVPIRVSIDNLDQQVPSGLRLNMTVRVHDHLKAMRNWFKEITGDKDPETPGTDEEEPSKLASKN